MIIKLIETRENESVEQLKQLLDHSFGRLSAGFQIKYSVSELNGKRGLYFEIRTRVAGVIYSNFKELKAYESPSDIEEPFINDIINELIMGGVTFLYTETINKLPQMQHGRNIIQARTLFLN